MPSITWGLDPFTPLDNGTHAIHEAWRKWEVASCIERHGEHLWYVIVVKNDEEDFVDLACEYCPVEVSDVFVTDYADLIHGTLGELIITEGKANLTGEYNIPVDVDFHAERYGYYEPEYDLWIELTLRGHPL